MSETKRKRIVAEERMKDAERQRRHRFKLNEKCQVYDQPMSTPSSTPSKVYSSKQAAGKALSRLRVKLPFSPRK